MIPRITAGGRSFKGAARYYLHDKGKPSRERVAWTETINLMTDDPDKAWKVMAWTAKEQERLKEGSGQRMTGRKLEKPVLAFSLSWHPEEKPEREHMLDTARKSIRVLNLEEHEAMIIAHSDEPQQHVHVLINRVHPVTGLVGGMGNSKRKLSDFARAYEQEHGKVYCQQREENYRKRKQGEKTMYRDKNIVQAWNASDNGKGFAAALREKGYQIAQGRKRLVIVDPYGQAHNPTRHLENVRAKDFGDRVHDLDPVALPDATKLSREIQTANRRRYDESLRHDEKSAQHQARTQSRHLEEQGRTSTDFDVRAAQERQRLEEHYRFEDQHMAIDALRQKTESPSWWRRLFGLARRDRERLENLEQSLADAKRRTEERMGAVEAERQATLAALKQRQELERTRDAEAIQAQRPKDYADEIERQKIIKHIQEKRQERSRSGPSMER